MENRHNGRGCLQSGGRFAQGSITRGGIVGFGSGWEKEENITAFWREQVAADKVVRAHSVIRLAKDVRLSRRRVIGREERGIGFFFAEKAQP